MVPGDRLQVGGHVTDARGGRLTVRLRSAIMSLGGTPMLMCGGQVRLPSPDVCLIRVARR